MDLNNEFLLVGHNLSSQNNLTRNQSAVSTANTTDSQFLSTTTGKLFNNVSDTTSSTVRQKADTMDNVWLDTTNILDTVLFVCACVALIFNLSNIFIIIISKLYRKTTYKFFISQALSNALIALCLSMGYISAKYLSGDTKLILDIIVYNIYQIGSMACVLTYTAISADLFFQIILPFKYRSMALTFKVVLSSIWFIPVILTESIQVGITLHNKASNETFLVTYVRLQDNTLGYFNTGLAFVCLAVIICLNVAVLKTVYHSLKSNPREGKSSKKSTITIVAMVTTYIIFYLPNWILGIIFIFHYKSQILILASLTMYQRRFLISLLSNMKILNTVSDPLIYVLRINVIRETYKKILLKLKCCGHHQNTDVGRLTLTSDPGCRYRDSTRVNKISSVSQI